MKWIACLLLLIVSPVVHARTIELTDVDCHKFAVISSAAPLMSWAAFGDGGVFSNFHVDLDTRSRQDRLILIQFPLDQIPDGMRVIRAELILPVTYVHPVDSKPRLHIRRIVGEWGAGVCHEYRMINPKRVKWSSPGASHAGRDRARRLSKVARVKKAETLTVTLTEDVELWNSGTVPNNGWMISLDDPHCIVRMHPPTWNPKTWKLRITFEPR